MKFRKRLSDVVESVYCYARESQMRIWRARKVRLGFAKTSRAPGGALCVGRIGQLDVAVAQRQFTFRFSVRRIDLERMAQAQTRLRPIEIAQAAVGAMTKTVENVRSARHEFSVQRAVERSDWRVIAEKFELLFQRLINVPIGSKTLRRLVRVIACIQ